MRARGFSLMETMIALIIIGLISSMIGVSVLKSKREADRKIAATQIQNLREVLASFHLKNHRFPTSEEGLAILAAEDDPFMESVPEDPWDHAYVYLRPGTHNPKTYDLFSYGPDGIQSEDDIGNWK